MSVDKNDKLYPMRHSLAHITAAAVRRLWPEAKFGVGPVVENGFYYDIDLGEGSISEEDFPKIESEMKKIIKEAQPFEHFMKPINEAIIWAEENKQPYKRELLNDIKRAGTTIAKELDASELGLDTGKDSHVSRVSFYKNGDFIDLCRGPHVQSTGKVGAFKLMRIAGAYWRGKENNPQMQRLYGVAFETQKELDDYLQLLSEAKARDHRKIGQELDLFTISDLVGAGLPLFTPRGTLLRQGLIRLSEDVQRARGYQAVWAPHITKVALYKTSGHYDKFTERFTVTSSESDDEFMMKPMNCPHVTQIYAARPRSYRDLPLRYMETTTMYRDEKSGELHGLSRVRALTQDDSHVFSRFDQIEDEVMSILEMVKEVYEVLDIKFRVDLSFRDDTDNYLGDPKIWKQAQQIIEQIAEKAQLNYEVHPGEAAFYGPKIDIYISDSLGREWQCATVQLDFIQPERFGLEYTAADGTKQQPVMIHKTILGSIERFLSVYIEHTNGWFPFWLAPEQLRILTINDTVSDYVDKIKDKLSSVVLNTPILGNQLRYTIDDRNESLGRKIRDAMEMKVPVVLVIGNKDAKAEQVSIRQRDLEEKVLLQELPRYLQRL